jgi:hypothetical protein
LFSTRPIQSSDITQQVSDYPLLAVRKNDFDEMDRRIPKSQIQKPNFKGSGIDNQNDKANIPAMSPLPQPKANLA